MPEPATLPPGPGKHHVRLILFFAGLAVLGVLGGTAALRLLVPEGEPFEPGIATTVLVCTVLAVSAGGFLAVFLHRLYVLPMKQREIERYLLRIERESAKHRALLAGAVDMLVLADPATGEVRECNAAARELLGLAAPGELAAGEAPRSRMADFLKPGARELVGQLIEQAAAVPGRPFDLPEVLLRAPDGRSFPAAARVVVIRVAGEETVELVLRDLSARHELEQRLRLHERLGSLGLLTASVAHEINNPLEGIGNYLSLLERPELPPERREHYLEQVRHGFGLIRDIVRDLLRFARPGVQGREADLRLVAERALRLASYAESCKQVALELDAPEGATAVYGDATRLEQLVLNLVLNAAKAMGGRGRVRVALRAGVGERGESELTVSDEGPGIPEEDLARLFDPFFTTGDGTGLGLSIAYGIVRAHGGTIEARNLPGAGAEFRVRLPSTGDPTEEQSA